MPKAVERSSVAADRNVRAPTLHFANVVYREGEAASP